MDLADIPPDLVSRAAVERRRSGGDPSAHDMERLLAMSTLQLDEDGEAHQSVRLSLEHARRLLRTRVAEFHRTIEPVKES